MFWPWIAPGKFPSTKYLPTPGNTPPLRKKSHTLLSYGLALLYADSHGFKIMVFLNNICSFGHFIRKDKPSKFMYLLPIILLTPLTFVSILLKSVNIHFHDNISYREVKGCYTNLS